MFFLGSLSACAPGEVRDTRHFAGSTMGTTYKVTLVAEPGESFEFIDDHMQEAIDAQLQLINQHMSTYIADSELMRFNAAEQDIWHPISAPMAEVLQISQSVSEASEGSFDITVGPLVNLWGFGPDASDDRIPDAELIAEAKSRVGYQKLELEGLRARKTDDIFVDLSGVAKGYGADWLAEFLAKQGLRNYLVEIGGDLRGAGVNPRGVPWRIAVEEPSLTRTGVRKVVALDNRGMVTSGDYRNYFEVDGRRFSHTIDPTTGYPVEHDLVSVTVLAETAAHADAWATAIMVLGPERGMALAEQEQLAVFMLLRNKDAYSEKQSSQFAHYLTGE